MNRESWHRSVPGTTWAFEDSSPWNGSRCTLHIRRIRRPIYRPTMEENGEELIRGKSTINFHGFSH